MVEIRIKFNSKENSKIRRMKKFFKESSKEKTVRKIVNLFDEKKMNSGRKIDD